MGRFRTLSVVDDDLFWNKSADKIKELGRLDERADMIRMIYKAGFDIATIHKITGFTPAFIHGVTAQHRTAVPRTFVRGTAVFVSRMRHTLRCFPIDTNVPLAPSAAPRRQFATSTNTVMLP